MADSPYQRNPEGLRENASLFWPSELSRKEAELSVVPLLLETQDQFIAILSVSVSNLEGLFQVVNSSTLSANLFLKHLIVLSDFGGEMLQRVNKQFAALFPSGVMNYIWRGQTLAYQFEFLPINGTLNNSRLGVDGKKLIHKMGLTELVKDVIALLLLGNACADERVAEILSKCEVSNYLGQPDKLDKYIRQRYLWVSRITGGAKTNNLGQLAQTFVKQYLDDHLNLEGIVVRPNGHIPGVSHTESERERLTTFDLVVHRGDKYAAIEVSFQVTTNSVIERKAGQARSRYEQIEREGYKIAYVIDGAGNFQRETALNTLCSFSHCTVAFSNEELAVLCEFLRDYFAQK
jgi:hypothetical protein